MHARPHHSYTFASGGIATYLVFLLQFGEVPLFPFGFSPDFVPFLHQLLLVCGRESLLPLSQLDPPRVALSARQLLLLLLEKRLASLLSLLVHFTYNLFLHHGFFQCLASAA